MNNRERFIHTMRYEPVDHRPLHLVSPWPDTLARWRREGLPAGVDVHDYLGVVPPVRVTNVSPITGVFPPYETRTVQEDESVRISIDGYGRTVREFKDHTSMPEWLEFPVKTPEDLRRAIDEHYRVDNLDERFPPTWEAKIRAGVERGDLLLADGGCYYWTLRSLAGVEYASYLFYDAPELVDELFERYNTVVLEGLRRAMTIAPVDVIGFGEDIGFKTGPLISPAMFTEYLLPRYRKVMELAHSYGIDLTWYDSDGDVRLFIPDYLSVGISTLAPVEVAAEMVPVELRKTYGRNLRLIGGIDKREIAKGKAAIDAEIVRNQPLIDEGGFLPAIDHSVPADISFADYAYFVEKIQRALGW